eukprot:g13627.t1
MPEEVCEKSNIVTAQYSMNKNYRVAKRKAAASERKIWTKTQLDRARGRAHKHWPRRKVELMQTYRDAYYKLHRIQEGVAKMNHSRAAAEVAKVESKAVRRWVKDLCKGGAFVVPKRQHNKREPHSFIKDEDKCNHLREYIDRRLYRWKKDEPRLRIADVQKWINEELLKDELGGTKRVSRRTVHKWMHKLGFRWSRHHKCVYVDGHNRPHIANNRRGFVGYLLGRRKEMSIPIRVEDTVMMPTSRGALRQQGASGDSDVSDEEGGSRASSETGEVDQTNVPATKGREPLFWPAVREVDGNNDYKHVRVYGDGETSQRVAGDCTRVASDPRDLAASDSKGDNRLLPNEEVQAYYRPKKVKREELFWPAVRTVDGKEEYKHVRVHDPAHARGRDGVRVRRLRQCPCETRRDKGRCSHFLACECDDCKRKPAVDCAQVAFYQRDLTATDGKGDYRLLPDHQVLSLYLHGETTAKENDGGDHQWVSTKKGAPMKVKGEGRAAHISDVIGVDLGQLQISKEAWCMMQEDKDADTGRSGKYFGRKEGEGVHGHEVKEVQDAVEVLKTAAADCAVLKTGTTLGRQLKIFLPKTQAEKKQKGRKNGTTLDKKKFFVGTKVVAGSPLLGLNKGAEQMLREMALWRLDGERKNGLLQICNKCKANNAASRQAITAFNKGGEERERVLEQARREQQTSSTEGPTTAGGAAGTRQRCWAYRVFSDHLDKVEEIFKKAGHVYIFLPKYHPELNAIERYWGYIKHVIRLRCEYSLPHMLKILPGTMSGVPLGHIRAWSRVAWLYVEAYDDGLEDYLKDCDLKYWNTPREATKRGDPIVEAGGGGGSKQQQEAAVAKAMAASKENRTFSVHMAKWAFKKWKRKMRPMANAEEEKEAENDVS